MTDKLPTLDDLPRASSPPVKDEIIGLAQQVAAAGDAEITAARALLTPAVVSDPEAPEGYWVQAVDKAGRRSTRTFRRYDDTFTNGEAVVPARATIEFEGGLNGAARPRRLAVDVYRDDFGYRVIPIPPGTPLVASADVERFKGQGAIR